MKLLEQDIEIAAKSVEDNVKEPLTDNEFGALVSFAFNLGSGTFVKSSIPGKLNAGNKDEACETIKKYVYANKQKLPGLVTRRENEVELFRTAPEIPAHVQYEFHPRPSHILSANSSTFNLNRRSPLDSIYLPFPRVNLNPVHHLSNDSASDSGSSSLFARPEDSSTHFPINRNIGFGPQHFYSGLNRPEFDFGPVNFAVNPSGFSASLNLLSLFGKK